MEKSIHEGGALISSNSQNMKVPAHSVDATTHVVQCLHGGVHGLRLHRSLAAVALAGSRGVRRQGAPLLLLLLLQAPL